MAITQALCTSFKKELFQGTHAFASSGGDAFKIALFTSSATLDATTTAYATTNEVVGTGYTGGGNALTVTAGTPASASTTGYVDFSDSSWTTSTFTARGALIYNTTDTNKAVGVLDFGSDKSVSAGTFTIQFPTPDQDNAILRIR